MAIQSITWAMAIRVWSRRFKEQLDDLPFAPRRFTNEPAVALAEKLGGIAPR